MSDGAWSFRTTEGVVTVRDDAITTRSSPWRFLAAQSARWSRGGRRARVAVSLVVGAFVLSLVWVLTQLYRLIETGFGLSGLFIATSVACFGYSFWHKYLRTTTIRRSAVSSVTLDDDSQQLTVTHATGDGPLSAFREEVTDTTFTLGTEDELRRARETLRLRGIMIEEVPTESGTEVRHRIVAEDGGYFCERCEALVTPNDKVCRRCDYTLWVEESTIAEQEPSTGE